MSDERTYKVPLTEIKAIHPHDNADRLEVAEVYGFQVIIKKDSYKVGDKVLYIPINSILSPELDFHIFPPDSKIKLHKRKVKQIRIRGLASQGMLISPEDIQTVYNFTPNKLEKDYAEKIKVIKYEPELPKFQQQGQQKKKVKPLVNSNFQQYNGLTNIKWCPYMFKEGELVTYQEKIHGCLDANTKISMADGTEKTIKEIVEKKISDNVLGLDDEGKIIETPITSHFNNGKNGDWVKIRFTKTGVEKGKSFGIVKATTNHKFYVEGLYKQAKDLRIGDKLTFKRQNSLQLSNIQKDVLIGKMLGDGSLSNRAVTFGHKKDHEEYVDYTLSMLGDVAGNKQKDQLSGYGSTMSRARSISSISIENYFKDWFVEEKKIIPSNLQLSPISLAFWYMDDGCLITHERQEDRASFATNGFDEISVNYLLIALEKLGLNGVKYQSNGWRIRLNSDDADKLFVMIAPYIPLCMKYKLPERYRDLPLIKIGSLTKYKPTTVIQEILNIEPWNKVDKKENLYRWDIETGTHNFFANGILVHNSNARAGIVPFQANTFLKKVKKFFGLAPKYEFVYGSNRIQLQARKGYTGFYGEDIYGNVFKDLKVEEKLEPNEVVYGEIYGAGIQKNYDYGMKTAKRFVLFDVKVINEDGTQTWLSPDEVFSFSIERGFKIVPEVYRGPYSGLDHVKSFTLGGSVLSPQQKVREGIVVKSIENYVDERGSKRALKAISEKYLDKDQTDFH